MLHHLQKLFGHRIGPDTESGGFLVGLFGTPADVLAVRLVERLAGSQPLRLARVVETPRDKCLAEPSIDEENAERKRLRLGRLSQASLQLTCCRNPGKKLLEFAEANQPELLVLALSHPADEEKLGLVRWILKESKSDILLVMVDSHTDVEQSVPTQVVLPILVGQAWPRRLLAEAARLAGPHGSVEVAGLLIVPRSLPLEAPLEEDEASLRATIRDTTLALTIAGADVSSRVLRARDPQEALCRLRSKSGASKMILERSEFALGDAASRAAPLGPCISLVRQTRPSP